MSALTILNTDFNTIFQNTDSAYCSYSDTLKSQMAAPIVQAFFTGKRVHQDELAMVWMNSQYRRKDPDFQTALTYVHSFKENVGYPARINELIRKYALQVGYTGVVPQFKYVLNGEFAWVN